MRSRFQKPAYHDFFLDLLACRYSWVNVCVDVVGLMAGWSCDDFAVDEMDSLFHSRVHLQCIFTKLTPRLNHPV
jgi:hypothetical protein